MKVWQIITCPVWGERLHGALGRGGTNQSDGRHREDPKSVFGEWGHMDQRNRPEPCLEHCVPHPLSTISRQTTGFSPLLKKEPLPFPVRRSKGPGKRSIPQVDNACLSKRQSKWGRILTAGETGQRPYRCSLSSSYTCSFSINLKLFPGQSIKSTIVLLG